MAELNLEDKKKTLGGNLVYSLIVTVIIGLVNIAYPLLIGLIYGPEILGNFSVLFYWSTILNIPISNGIAPAISRFISISKTNNRFEIEQIGSKISLYYLIGVVLVYPFLGYFVFKLPFVEIVIILILLFSLIYHYLYRNSLQGEERFPYLFKQEIISFSFFLPLMIVFSILPKYLEWNNLVNIHYFFIPIIGYHISFVLLVLIQKKKRTTLLDLFKLPSFTKRILLYALFMGLGGLFSFGMSQIQIIVSDSYLNEFEVGVLSFWSAAVAAINLFTVGLRAILLPRITNLQNLSRNDTSDLSLKFTKSLDLALVLLVLPISCLLFVIIQSYPSFLDILTFNKYNMTQYWLIVILFSSREILLLILSPSITYILSSEKYIMFNPIFSFINAISIILAWIFMIPIYGIFGFAAGLVIGSFILNLIITLLLFIISKRKNGFHLILILIYSSLLIGTLYLHNVWSSFILIILWCVIFVVSIIFGIIQLNKILKNQDFMKSKNSIEISPLKDDETINV